MGQDVVYICRRGHGYASLGLGQDVADWVRVWARARVRARVRVRVGVRVRCRLGAGILLIEP